MIKFFRKIRHRLLSESKFSKYLLYAIGEIVLVVIGILIAVQINDWNEDRKVSKANRVHLQKMVAEMDENIARMRMLTSDNEGLMYYGFPPLDEAILNCDSILKLSYMGLSEEHLPFILNARFFAGRSVLNLQQDVFEELKSTGRLNTLGTDSLITAIKGYSKRYLREKYYNTEHNDNIIRSMEKLEEGFGKMILDYQRDSIHFSINKYPWYFDPTSEEYKILQISFAQVLNSQEKNYGKMMDIEQHSEALKRSILNHLNSAEQ
ncbi:MAG: hypothetical protein HKO93_00030 [Flavobacteriales bacterium]|nr:hypothetical protein [Flavobacteriales bacterium]